MNNNDTGILSSTRKTYKISIGWRLFIGGLAIAGLLAYVGILPFTDYVENSCKDFVLLLILEPFSAVIVFTIIYLFLNEITIFDGCIVQKNLFSEVKVEFSEIVGRKIISNRGISNLGIILYTNNKKKKIEISMMMENYYELTGWVSGRFKKMDANKI